MQTKLVVFKVLTAIFIIINTALCQLKMQESRDSVYSKHLQKNIDLTIISTPFPENKNEYNLLLVNDGQDIEHFNLKKIIDSLYKKNSLKPLLVICITPYDRKQEYGVAGYPDYQNNGSSAEKYGAFIADELLPSIKKRMGISSFASIAISGCSLGGLSAFDVAWDYADKIDKVGVFSGSFWYRYKDAKDPSYSDDKDRLIINKIRASEKKPHLKYWMYAGDKEETADRDNDGIIDVVDDTKDLIDCIKNKHVCAPGDIVFIEKANGTHDYNSWSRVLPEFLLWADGK